MATGNDMGRASTPRVFLIFAGLCAVITLAPLPLGAARPLAWDALALVVAWLLLGSVTTPMAEGRPLPRSIIVAAVCFAVVGWFTLFQTSPWVPPTWRNPLWDLAQTALTEPVRGSIAVDRPAAFVGLLRLSTYVGVFWLAALLTRAPERAHAALKWLVISGCAYAVYGLLVYWSGNRTILWLPKWAYQDDLTGTFVNHNSFATYLGLCLLAAICRLLAEFETLSLHGDRRRRLVAAIERVSRQPTRILAIFILATALLLTHSRGGLIATSVGVLALTAAVVFAPSLRRLRRIGLWIFIPFAVFLFALLVSGGATLDRFLTADVDSAQRLEVYRLIVEGIKDYPILGVGLGSFTAMFPVYRTAQVTGYFDLAHNDYLQNLFELGLPIGLLWFATIGGLAAQCLRGIWIRHRHALFPCLGFAATVLVGVHSAVDFSLQIPAVTAVYALLLGVGVAQAQSSRAEPRARATVGGLPRRDRTPPVGLDRESARV